MAKASPYKHGDIFFYANGHVVEQKLCVRGEPPKGTKLWAVHGEPGPGWRAIEDYHAAMARPGGSHG